MEEENDKYPYVKHLFFIECMAVSLVLFSIIDENFQCLYFKKKTRNYLYRFITNKTIQWILDTFFSLQFVIEEFEAKKWKLAKYRILIYITAVLLYKITASILILFIVGMLISYAIDAYQRYRYSHETKFNFQSLPYPIQQRFYELQPPLIRYTLPKACFNKALIKSYNQLYVDELCLNSYGPCKKIYESFPTHFDSYKMNKLSRNDMKLVKEINFECNLNKCTCEIPQPANRIIAVKTFWIIGFNIPEWPIVLNLNLKKLVVISCILQSKPLQLIKQMNLEYIKLDLIDDGTEYLTKMNEMLEVSNGITVINLKYKKKCENQKEFDKFMQNWMEENNYEMKKFTKNLCKKSNKNVLYEIV